MGSEAFLLKTTPAEVIQCTVGAGAYIEPSPILTNVHSIGKYIDYLQMIFLNINSPTNFSKFLH